MTEATDNPYTRRLRLLNNSELRHEAQRFLKYRYGRYPIQLGKAEDFVQAEFRRRGSTDLDWDTEVQQAQQLAQDVEHAMFYGEPV